MNLSPFLPGEEPWNFMLNPSNLLLGGVNNFKTVAKKQEATEMMFVKKM